MTLALRLAMRFWGFLASFFLILLLTWWRYGGVWAFVLLVLAFMGEWASGPQIGVRQSCCVRSSPGGRPVHYTATCGTVVLQSQVPAQLYQSE